MGKPEARAEEEVARRDFRISNRILEKYGHTPGCIGCEAALGGTAMCKRLHTEACRSRIEKRMLEDPEEKGWIEKRDKRRPTGTTKSGASAAPSCHACKWRRPKRTGHPRL